MMTIESSKLFSAACRWISGTPILSVAVLVVVLLPVTAWGQEQTTIAPERKPIDWFHEDANFHKKPLLIKLLQFTAPYPGYYQQTSLDTDGNAFTARNVPNWAMQGSSFAKLSDSQLTEIKQMLAQLNVPSTPETVEPQQNRLHSAFIFYNGHDFLRFNYNGPNPTQIDAIMELLKKEFMAADRVRREEFAAHQKLMRESYGDWQNRPGLTLNAGSSMHNCKGTRALLMLTEGQRKTVAGGSPLTVSLYHALVFYPPGIVVGSGGGGQWSDDPVQSHVIIWTALNGNSVSPGNGSQRKLEVFHNAIDATITIAGKTFHLPDGNMFVVQVGADWEPTVAQLKDVFDEKTTPQDSLNRFKALFKNDPAIQQLELY